MYLQREGRRGGGGMGGTPDSVPRVLVLRRCFLVGLQGVPSSGVCPAAGYEADAQLFASAMSRGSGICAACSSVFDEGVDSTMRSPARICGLGSISTSSCRAIAVLMTLENMLKQQTGRTESNCYDFLGTIKFRK